MCSFGAWVIKPPIKVNTNVGEGLACSNSKDFQPKMAGGWEEVIAADAPLKKSSMSKIVWETGCTETAGQRASSAAETTPVPALASLTAFIAWAQL